MTSPSGSQTLNGTVDITWTSADADGHALSYTVLYSADGGDRWVPIAVDLTSKSFAWDTSLAAATTTGEIMVVASDGVNQGSDTATGPFTIAPNLPVVGITSPADGTTVAAGQPLLLQGPDTTWQPVQRFSIRTCPGVRVSTGSSAPVPISR